MSDTPRTDAGMFGECCATDFARELERDNAALRARLAEVERELEKTMHVGGFAYFSKQRDEAKKEAQRSIAIAKQWKSTAEQAERERDEARKARVDYCMEIDRIMKERDAARAENAKMVQRVRGEFSDDCPFCARVGMDGTSQQSPMCGLCQAESERETLRADNARLASEIERWRDATNRLRSEMEHQSARANSAEADNELLRELLCVAHCPNCGGVGYTVGADKYGEPVQIQCE